MKQCRNNVFETNSSSVHAISISKDGLEPSKLYLDENDKIIVELGSFGCNDELTTQDEKLSYLMTCMYYIYPNIPDKNSRVYLYESIKNVICKYADADDIILTNIDGAYIDHQSAPYDTSDLIINIYDEDSIIDFIFNKYITVKMYRDERRVI